MSYTISPTLLTWLIILAVWELLWKGMALWRAVRNGHGIWFAAILILNTAGLLPMIYILWEEGRSGHKGRSGTPTARS